MKTLFLKAKNQLIELILQKTIPCLFLLFCIGIGIALSSMSNLSRDLIESQALLNSEAQANSIINAWSLYSQSVAIRLQKTKNISISHDYFMRQNSIPPPATFTIQLGSNISQDQEGLSIRLYSNYPWPWRKNEGGARTPFEREALTYFKEHPEEQKFYRIETSNNRYTWRYAQAVIMETSCVACHNTDPNSPKKDWNVGDIRGAIAITQSLEGLAQTNAQGIKQTFVMLGCFSILTISGLALVIGRLNQTTKELENRVRERTATLAETNQTLEQRNVLIRQVFGRYLSNEIVENLLDNPQSLALGGERRKITILTSDLRGFTAISESLSAEEVITILNIYLEKMANIINKYEGTINEIMGDGILVLFGAPTERENDTERAIACAVAMQLAMEEINQRLRKLGFPKLAMGIGINTGLVILGNIGSEKRTKYGVVGSQVNLTYRIESYSIGGEILLAESTYNECRELLSLHSQKQVQAKGVKEAIVLYVLEGIKGNYNLFLPLVKDNLFTLEESISLQYQVLEGKHLENTIFTGQLTELSQNCAKIVMDSSSQNMKLSPYTNLKLNLHQSVNSKSFISNDIYGKISDRPVEKGSFYLDFTSQDPILDEILAKASSL